MSGARMLRRAVLTVLLCGCATTSELAARQELMAGIQTYENGQYAASVKRLEAAIGLGLVRPDEVTARKYLAFVHCVSRREMQCRYEFRLAIAIDPAFELAPAEAGHPLWGPVFRDLKGRR